MECKICPKCKKSKELDDFGNNKSGKNGKQRTCKKCVAEEQAKCFSKTKDNYLKRYKIQSDKGRDYVDEIRKNSSCVKCGEEREWTLDFHHVESDKKEYNIGTLRRSGSFQKLKKEIEKCIILCKNCHAEFHYLERNEKITIKEYINTKTVVTERVTS